MAVPESFEMTEGRASVWYRKTAYGPRGVSWGPNSVWPHNSYNPWSYTYRLRLEIVTDDAPGLWFSDGESDEDL